MRSGGGRVFGRQVAVVACGSTSWAARLGVAAANGSTAVVERATAERLLLACRLGRHPHEGTVAFLRW